MYNSRVGKEVPRNFTSPLLFVWAGQTNQNDFFLGPISLCGAQEIEQGRQHVVIENGVGRT